MTCSQTAWETFGKLFWELLCTLSVAEIIAEIRREKKCWQKNIDNLGKVSKAEDGTFRVRVRYTIPGGKTMDIKKRAKTKREAQVILEVLLQEAKVNLGAKTIHFSEYTVEQYFKKVFLPFKERKIKAQSYRRLESIVDTHIIPAHGKRIFCKLQSDDITALLDRLTEKGYSYVK